MLALLALKVAPTTVNTSAAIGGIRLVGVGPPTDVDGGRTRPVAGVGVLAFLLCGWLAIKQLPRPYLARGETELAADDQGTVTWSRARSSGSPRWPPSVRRR